MRSFLLLAFMTPFALAAIERPTLYYDTKIYNSDTSDGMMDYQVYIKLHKRVLAIASIIASKMNAVAIKTYNPDLEWISPELDITQRIIDILDVEEKNTCKCVCE